MQFPSAKIPAARNACMALGVLCALLFPVWFLGGGVLNDLLWDHFQNHLYDKTFWLGFIFVPLSPFLFLLGFQPRENTPKWRAGLLYAACAALAVGATGFILMRADMLYEITMGMMFGSAVTGPLLALWLLLRRKEKERMYVTALRLLGAMILLFSAMPHAIFAILSDPR